MSEKAVLSLDKNNIPGPLEGGQTFPPASHQEVGVGSAQRENRGEGEQPEPSKQTMIAVLNTTFVTFVRINPSIDPDLFT